MKFILSNFYYCFIILFIALLWLFLQSSETYASGPITKCSGKVISLPGVEKNLLPFTQGSGLINGTGRPGDCIKPTKIVVHVTASNMNANQTRDYFASGSSGRGVSSQFIIDRDGRVLQILDTLDDKVEKGFSVLNYNDEVISIEQVSPAVYNSKSDAPPPQYTATLQLVQTLMNQYHIPLGNLQYDWEANQGTHSAKDPVRDNYDPSAGPGVYGHYQLNPASRSDPGKGWMKDFRDELNTNQSNQNGGGNASGNQASSNCVVTKVGNPKGNPQLPTSCTNNQTGGNETGLAKAALAVKRAFTSCSGGETTSTDFNCLETYVNKQDFTKNQEDAFKNQLEAKDSQGYLMYVPGEPQGNCVQCISFVVLAHALDTTQVANSYSSATNYADGSTIPLTEYKYDPNNQTPEPGDIAVTNCTIIGGCSGSNNSEYIKDAGHISIVRQIDGKTSFIALEANYKYNTEADKKETGGGQNCYASEHISHLNILYHFLKKKK